nr:hypothetical protein [Tanacetum cinerariifolium]
MNGKDLSKEVALDLGLEDGRVCSLSSWSVESVSWNRMTSKQANLIQFVWRVKEIGRSGWLCFLDRWEKMSRRKAKHMALSLVHVACIRRRFKKTLECVACLLGRWNRSCGIEYHGIALVVGKTTRREHYGSGSSNRVASDVTEEEVVDPGKVEMVLEDCQGGNDLFKVGFWGVNTVWTVAQRWKKMNSTWYCSLGRKSGEGGATGCMGSPSYPYTITLEGPISAESSP